MHLFNLQGLIDKINYAASNGFFLEEKDFITCNDSTTLLKLLQSETSIRLQLHVKNKSFTSLYF